ncbi:conserved hypothetical protein [uncultured Paludibacter sp.]|uniref:Uncharacterized protein n=1 Tax=uncultured Paludibacter sp. TaxID=497635 RepID=A0A653AHC4_9BACT|nr:conserved hypothetical protein [uncultured Paludibacter sp.]
MKKGGYIYLIISVLFITTFVYGQDEKYEYGKISQEEFDMKSYSKDKDAEAVVLFDIGKSYFNRTESGFKVVFEKHTRIKVLSDAGIKYGEIDIPFYQQGNIFEKIEDLEGFTYNPDEKTYVKKSMLNINNSFDEKLNENWKLKKFAMPDVKAGSIIEYRYKIYSEYVFNLRDWEFQWKIPVIYSKYIVSLIPFYEYTWLFQGGKKFDEKKSYIDKGNDHYFAGIKYQNYNHEFVIKDLPAFNDEEFITSKNDYITKIDFQLSKVNQVNGTSTKVITTWEEMNKELLNSKDFGKYISRAEKIGSKSQTVQRWKTLTDEEKFDNIIEYVKTNYNWNGRESKFASKSPSDFEKEKTGNSADINLFTVGLLKSVGINANPVIVSTREHGRIKYDYPYMHFFNYVIILADVNGKKVLSDASEIMCLNNRVSERCINNKGLIVQKDKVEWVNTTIPIVSEDNTNMKFIINPDNSIKANITKFSTEYSALDYKKTCGEDKEDIKNHFKSETYEIVDSTFKTANFKKRNKIYALTFDVINKPEIINEKMYIDPFLKFSLSENPLKQPERTYPIDMIYPKKNTFNTYINVPDNWKIDYLPDNVKVDNELFSIEYKTIKDNNNINVTFSYFFKKPVYSENHYLLIKSYFNDIVNKGNEKIVLSKI